MKKCAHCRQKQKAEKIMLLILEFVIILLLAIALLSQPNYLKLKK